MQRILDTSLDSIGLAGLHGISLPELWALLEGELQITIDDYLKNWIWQQIRASEKLEYFLSDKDEPALAKSEIKGLRGCYDPQRKKADDITLNKSATELTALGNKFRIVIDQDSRDRALGITDPDLFMNDIQYRILELLALARTNGIFQTDLAAKLNVDAKTVFFHLKKLEVHNLLVRKSVLRQIPGKPSAKTNIIHLKRFSSDQSTGGDAPDNDGEEIDDDEEEQENPGSKEFIYYTSIEQRVCDMLSSARQNILRESEINRALNIMMGSKKIWPTIRKNLTEDGFIKLFDAKLPDSEELISCVRLLKPYTAKDDHKGMSSATAMETRKAVAELSIDYQIYKFIESAGAAGVFKNDIARIINALSRRSLTNKMHTMTSEYDILAIPEVHGKQTAYRFVLSRFMNDQNLQHVSSTVLPKELNVKRKTPSKTTPTKSAIVVDESSQSEVAQAPAEGEVFATPKKAAKKSKATPAKNNTNVASPPSTPAKSADETSQGENEATTPSRRTVVTLQNSQRKQVIVDELQKHKVLLETNLRRVLEEKVPSETKIDLKTIKRMVTKMEKDNELKILNTTVPQMSGAPKKFTLLIMPHLTIESPEVKDVIERLRDSQFVIKQTNTPSKLKANKEVVELEEVDRVEQLPVTVKQPPRDGLNIQTSLQYGYVRAKMIRVKMLHQFLWLQVFEGNNNGTAKKNVTAILRQGKTKYPEEMTEKEKEKLNELTTGEKKATPKSSKKSKIVDSNALLTNLVGSAYRPTTETTLSQCSEIERPNNNNNAMEVDEDTAKDGNSKKGKKSKGSTTGANAPTESGEKQTTDDTVDLDDFGAFQVHDILNKMPLDLYLQIIGSTQEIAELEDLREQNVTFGEVPDHIKQILMRKRYSFKRLALLLDTLKRLGLVISSIAREEDVDPTNASSVVVLQADAPAFYLTKVGRIKDTAKVPPETRTYKFESLAEVMRYWSELEYIALHRVLENDDDENSSEEVAEVTPANHSNLPPEVLVRYNWTGLNVLTNYQKKVLNDNKEDVTEDNEEYEKITPKVQEVAKKSRLSPQQVLMFYKKIKLRALKRARTIAKKKEAKQKTEKEEIEEEIEDLNATAPRRRSSKKKAAATTDEDEMSTDEPRAGTNALFGSFNRPQRPGAAQRPSISIRFDTGNFGALRGAIESATPGENQLEYAREEEEEFDLEEEQQATKTRVRPTRKVFWNSEEDFIILKHYTVQRADNPSLGPQDDVDWTALANIIHKPPEACKKRLKYLMRFTQCQRAVQAAIEQRHKQQSSKDAGDMSALSSALTTLEKQAIAFDLPKSIKDFEQLFDVESVQKPELQLSVAANTVLADYLKCILMIPEEEYLPEAAYKFLANFDREEITQSFEVLRKEGIIIQTKSYAGAPKSSRGFKISFKYQQMFGKPVSEQLISEAVEFEQKLSTQNEEDEMIIKGEIAPAGGMVHQGILNLIRQNLHPEISIEEVEPKRRRWKSAKEKENEKEGKTTKKGKKTPKKTPAKGKKKNNNNLSVDEDNESENEGEKSSAHDIESDASDEEDEPQMRNYLLSEIKVPEVHVQFVKKRFPDAIMTADDEDEENPQQNRVPPANDDRTLMPPRINTWEECAEFLKIVPYYNENNGEDNDADPITHLNAAEIESAKKIYDFIESFAAAAVNQSRLKDHFKNEASFDKLLNALHMSGIIERVTAINEYAWVERKFLGRWTVTPYKIIKPREEAATAANAASAVKLTEAANAAQSAEEEPEVPLTRKRKRAASTVSQASATDEGDKDEPKKKRQRTSSRISAKDKETTVAATETNNNNNTNAKEAEKDQGEKTATTEPQPAVTPKRTRMLQEVVAFSKDSHVVLYPWIKLDGSVDKATLSRLKRNIFSLVHQNPGISEPIEQKFLFKPVDVKPKKNKLINAQDPQLSKYSASEGKGYNRACDVCRKQHAKCNGDYPCKTCTERGKTCTYSNASPKEVILRTQIDQLKVEERNLKSVQQRNDELKKQKKIQELRMLHIYNAMWLQTSCDIQYLIDQYNFWVQPFTGVKVSMNPANFVTEDRMPLVMLTYTMLGHGALTLGAAGKADRFVTHAAKYAAELTDLRDPVVIAAYYNLGLFYVARGEMLSSRSYYLKVQTHLFNNPPSNTDAKWRLKNNNVEGNEGLIVDTRQIGQWINLWLSSVSPSTPDAQRLIDSLDGVIPKNYHNTLLDIYRLLFKVKHQLTKFNTINKKRDDFFSDVRTSGMIPHISHELEKVTLINKNTINTQIKMETECRAEIYKAWYHVLNQNFTYAKTLCTSVIKKFYQYKHFQDQFMLISLYFVVGQFALAMRDYDLEQQIEGILNVYSGKFDLARACLHHLKGLTKGENPLCPLKHLVVIPDCLVPSPNDEIEKTSAAHQFTNKVSAATSYANSSPSDPMQDSDAEPDPLALTSVPSSPNYTSYISDSTSEHGPTVYIPAQAVQSYDGRNLTVMNPQQYVYNPHTPGANFMQHNAALKAKEIEGGGTDPVYYTPAQFQDGNYTTPYVNTHTIYQTITINQPQTLYVVNHPQQ